jgi:AraC-like DNA-binding protein
MLHKDLLIRLCKARDLLRQTDEWLLVPQVAREIGMSPYHFSRLFRAVFGETPKQCQLKARLEKAKHELLTTDTSITDICLEAGFSSLGTFSYVFARRVGMTPTRYRQKFLPCTNLPGEMPSELIPGCFTLMSGPPQ